ncbi:glutamate synthase [Fulvitalea axinellae]|uniref:Glutamate synthase [NADPH] large chain n=1 Tax=Fulvitalea axinellae TaxID=1182444 RepID=A0AAU9D9Z4_9BACT|nr:glutamate synthase [Fulvitalea axinellae]
MREELTRSLYTPSLEHDACGIGFVANLKNRPSSRTITDALLMLTNMEHRGGCGCDPQSGDGAGILFQLPYTFFESYAKGAGFELPEPGKYGAGMIFFPSDDEARKDCKKVLETKAKYLGFEVLGYRTVPTDNSCLGEAPLASEPVIEQMFVSHAGAEDSDALERKLYVLRQAASHTINKEYQHEDFYVASFSCRVITYKGQLTTHQVQPYYKDLSNEAVQSAFAMVHSRFSTNTFPKWKLAQPFRFIAHNGEINTIRGNVNWMRSNETLLESTLFTREEIEMLKPVCDPANSDSANLDSMIELLMLGGRPLPHVMMMLVPEAWQEHEQMDPVRKAFYQFHASIMEPWDGPASICFTDGTRVGATLDRNGLRPSRYCVTDDDRVIMASEAGALPVDQSTIISKGRLQPGRMFVVDLEKGRIVSDEEIKDEICNSKPYHEWLAANEVPLRDIPKPLKPTYQADVESLLERQLAFGFTSEDQKTILGPMVEQGKEPLGSMGADTPLAILSRKSRHLSDYFKQLFAQVSNPPIDPLRERLVMSLNTGLGPTFNILSETPQHCKQIGLDQPVLTNVQLDKIRCVKHTNFRTKVIDILFDADGKEGRMEEAIDAICQAADEAIVNEGQNILLLSDRNITEGKAAIPSLLAVGAIHHHLVNSGTRVRVSLVVEAGDVRETHHFATLIGYGATAVNPYMAFETLHDMSRKGLLSKTYTEKELNKSYIKSIGLGLLKIFSKMGISTLQSYHGAQIFEALGVSSKVVDKCFAGTVSRIEGLDFDGIAKEVLARHNYAFNDEAGRKKLDTGGLYQWKRRGEAHLFNPETISLLQRSTRENNYSVYKEYASKINDQSKRNITLRSLLDFKKRESIPLEEVEPKESIFKRFATGAMSFGSISYEAHSTLAVAMNRIGGKSNSGEGGEDEVRFERKENGDWERSAIKQVASGRFGVTSHYLSNAEELQIKVAQGAKPGEGGQLPGHKVDDWIGRVRNSTPGVGLISPPPHHDIYSIEDLAQLIYDLKNANRKARINVKLVSEAGVGTVAAGVAKAKADAILISGYDGGTGASPLSSIMHAGLPWELGLAEAHQTLVKNKLRNRIVLQTDGQIRTGRDLAVAALLGAEEWGVSTAALVVEGCIMMRKCHLNTCPVGVATQRKELRKLFSGDPDHVVNMFSFLAEELREVMAELGFRTVDEMVGKAGDVLKVTDELDHWKLKSLDLSPVLYKEESDEPVYNTVEQAHDIYEILDRKMIEAVQPALEKGEAVKASFDIVNTNRSVGAMLSNEVSKAFGSAGLPDGTIKLDIKGSAGQSFGVFGAKGIEIDLEGEANDYFAKGLSGARIIVRPDDSSMFRARENIIVGNVALYGATSGEVFIRGRAGERFCVRNSGATAVVEGVGDHGCEYMTGGTAVVLGATGRNFAAGMSGGVAYVYDKENKLAENCNMELVNFDPMEDEDIERVNDLITHHAQLTGSGTAKRIIRQWEMALPYFKKVMPTDYKAVLLKRKAALQEKPQGEEAVA